MKRLVQRPSFFTQIHNQKLRRWQDQPWTKVTKLELEQLYVDQTSFAQTLSEQLSVLFWK